MKPGAWRVGLRRAWRAGTLLALAGAAWGFVIEPRRLLEAPHTLDLPGWPAQCDGLRVDALADLHVGSPHNGIGRLDHIVQRLAASDSDAVLLGGDYLIQGVALGRYVSAATIAEHLRPLTARKPVFAVLGNHDWWDDGPRTRAALESAGVVMLENDARRVRLRGCELWIVGIGDYWEGEPDLVRAFAPAAHDGLPVIALTHNPDLFPRMPARAALVVAGHTHGGQVALPLLGRPIVPSKYGERYAIGHIVEGGRHLFVTPGIGTSILPVRFGVPPEVSRLTLRGATPAPMHP
ncbi:metallophosphoesterase [Agrilutibacter solisilvae]|uniref:Metallophosphoesterase n=1 Tax=Agrilutibacter solisilvae TaxID=2763317 RepID=A0A974Y556_9GAMM|nr:metallophosphoesterase [Lysobacter solisilvae]QSX78451.1 metallophosphoesterase [Lysobacter solisilvae]